MYDTRSGESTDLGEAIPTHPSITSLVYAPDGKVYGTTGTYFAEGHLFYFDPENPGSVTDLGAPVPGTTQVRALTLAGTRLYGGASDLPVIFRYDIGTGDGEHWDVGAIGIDDIQSLVGAPDGLLYGGGYGGYGMALFFSFDPDQAQAQALGMPVPGDSYIEALVLAADGKVYGGTSFINGHLFSFDRTLGSFETYGAAVWRDTEILRLVVASDGQIYGGTGWKRGMLFRFNPLNHPMVPEGTASSLGISPRLERKTGVPDTPEVWALAAANDGLVYAAGYSAINLARLSRWDPATETMAEVGLVPGSPAAIYDLLQAADGLLYGGGGRWSGVLTMFSYDLQGGTFTYLPYDIIGQDYVYALTQCPNGLIFGGTAANGIGQYGHVFSYNPASGAFSDFGPALTGETAIQSLACSPDGVLIGGTSPNAHLFRLVPEAKMFEDLGQPVAGETRVQALAWGPDGLLYGGTEGRGFLFAYAPDPGTVEVIGRPFFQDRGVYDLTVASDGLVYGVTGYQEGHLFSYDPAAEALADLGKVTPYEGNVYSVEANRDASQIYVGSGYNYGDFAVYDAAYRFAWLGLDHTTVQPHGTGLAVDVLDLAGNVLLADVPAGASLVGLPPVPAVQLRATLSTNDPDASPALQDWAITWTDDPKLALAPARLSFEAQVGGPDPAPQELAVLNESGGELPWTVSNLPAWLSVDPPAGDAPASVTVTAGVAGLAPGVYTATLQFDGPAECINCPQFLPVSLRVGDGRHRAYLPLVLKGP